MCILRILSASLLIFGLSACAGGNENSGQTQSTDSASVATAGAEEEEFGSLGLKVGAKINLAGMGVCRVAQANGVELFKANTSRNDCINKCASYEATNEGRSCSHGSGFLRVPPRQVCQIFGASGVLHYYALSARMKCTQECNKASNPNRQCLWGGVSVKP
jgi:hypothetical protein